MLQGIIIVALSLIAIIKIVQIETEAFSGSQYHSHKRKKPPKKKKKYQTTHRSIEAGMKYEDYYNAAWEETMK